MSTDQTSSGSLTRLREKELILYVTFAVQLESRSLLGVNNTTPTTVRAGYD